MTVRDAILLVPVALLLAAADTMAQTVATGESRNYAAVFAGAELTPPDVAVAVEYGERVTPNVQAYVTLSYFDNLLSDDLEDELTGLSSSLRALTGTPWRFTGRDRGVSFVGGAKYLGRVSEHVRPYLGAGAGVLNIDRTITEDNIGDVTMAVFGDYGIGSAEMAVESQTGPLVELVAGVGFTPGRRTYVDIGYRFRKAFRLGEDVRFSQIVAGIGYRF